MSVGERLAEPCGNCDICLEPGRSVDATEAARKALSCVYRFQQHSGLSFGAGHLIDVLRGASSVALQVKDEWMILVRGYTGPQFVNGLPAVWAPWDARWTNTVTLQPGLNRVLVQAFGTNGTEVARTSLDLWYDTGASATVGGAIAADTTWSAARPNRERSG